MGVRLPTRSYYTDSIADFLTRPWHEILGQLTQQSEFAVENPQREAWRAQFEVLRTSLQSFRCPGRIHFEFVIPRIGRRVDVILLIRHVVFVIEFKAGEQRFTRSAIDQVFDYALDLKYFHETSHDAKIAPILVATGAVDPAPNDSLVVRSDGLLDPLRATPESLHIVLQHVLDHCDGSEVDLEAWEHGAYKPTPTIIEAAMALYSGHSVSEISRSDASAINLSQTSDCIARIIEESRAKSQKAICFVTGVPGAGKTLAGLNIATRFMDNERQMHSVFLSGNGPLVAVMREALAQDKVERERAAGKRLTKGEANRQVSMFIQNVHHFRDDCLRDEAAPVNHVAIFDEAQRAWDRKTTEKFMRQKKGRLHFEHSEPGFLISCMDRHQDWAVIICLVGHGQEIHEGEAGIGEWIRSIVQSFPHWHVHMSPRLEEDDYMEVHVRTLLEDRPWVHVDPSLHLGVSLRSFRAENLSAMVKHVLEADIVGARSMFKTVSRDYPLALTRSIHAARSWLRERARGSERYGIVAASKAHRLKPLGINVRTKIDPVNWFLKSKDDVRSSFYLEDVATEFQVQGLELDWACVAWDADLRFRSGRWQHFAFEGSMWKRTRNAESQSYLVNTYRVLLTRARQGMVICVPEGSESDATRPHEFYDETYTFLRSVGLPEV
jgi:hypothetical protein